MFSSIIPTLSIIAVIMAPMHAQQIANSDDCNALIFGNFKSNAGIEGRLCVSGNAQLTNYKLGTKLPADFSCDKYAADIGGSISFKSGSKPVGSIGAGDLANSTVSDSILNGCRLEVPAKTLEFAAAKDRLLRVSADMFKKLSTVKSRSVDANSTLVLEMSGASEEVLALNGFDLGGILKRLNVKGLAPKASITINIAGKEVAFNAIDLSAFDKFDVVFNCFEATSVMIVEQRVFGTLLAPLAKITGARSMVRGTVYAESFDGDISIQSKPLGCIASNTCRPAIDDKCGLGPIKCRKRPAVNPEKPPCENEAPKVEEPAKVSPETDQPKEEVPCPIKCRRRPPPPKAEEPAAVSPETNKQPAEQAPCPIKCRRRPPPPKAEEPANVSPAEDEPAVEPSCPIKCRRRPPLPKAEEPADVSPEADEPAEVSPEADQPQAETSCPIKCRRRPPPPKIEEPAAVSPAVDEHASCPIKCRRRPAPQAEQPSEVSPVSDQPAAPTICRRRPAAVSPETDCNE